ncbi:LysR family transcriptional regulator [Vibrio agarivorans]|uniref:LysR family transcriptional regulator n=1 Tax=Vibrio agarivorans TaxID=153622 RepID=UPI002231F26F|nr:LysR family transcriptional regulator [Vibrio agarivorans]
MAISIERLDKRDLRRLELFREIVEQGGISAATVSTGLSQPVLSSQLIELEKNLNLRLCERGRSGFDLTVEGQQVYDYANELDRLLTDFAFKLKGVSHKLTGHIRVGCLDNTVSLKSNPLPKAIEKFYQLSDGVELTLEVGDFTQLNDQLSKKQLDMMVVVLGDHQLNRFDHVTPLFSEKSFLYARNDKAQSIMEANYCLDGQRINMGGYAKEVMYQLLDLDRVKEAKLIDGWHVESGLMLTLAGTHLSFLPDHLIENNPNYAQLTALQPDKWVFESHFYLVSNSHSSRMSSVARAFQEILIK